MDTNEVNDMEPAPPEVAAVSVNETGPGGLPRHGAERPGFAAWLARPVVVFWVALVLICLGGAAARCFRIDMPPVDFPADRQKSNCMRADQFIRHEIKLLDNKQWNEVPFYPWLVARSAGVAKMLGMELWTEARLWSIFFGAATILFAGLAGFWAAAREAPWRRCLAGLLLAAALAANPYHIATSRMITTESLTVALQAAALAFFLRAYQRLGQRREAWRFGLDWALFLVAFGLAGMAKIPSLIWLPGYFLLFVTHRSLNNRVRWGGLAAIVLCTLAVFWVYKLNPFTLISSFKTTYQGLAKETAGWYTNILWVRSYVGRVVLMLTLPGAIFAVIGFLSAPWLFRLTMACYLAMFYFLNNLNTYNFVYGILPGMALAVWGVLLLADIPRLLRRERSGPAWAGRLETGAALALIFAIVFIAYPQGPNTAEPVPQGEIVQALSVIGRIVPPKVDVSNDDGQAVLSYLLVKEQGRHNTSTMDQLYIKKEIPFQYMLDRFGEHIFMDVTDAWLKWASVPGEFNGLLYCEKPSPFAAGRQGFVAMSRNRDQAKAPNTLEAETFLVEGEKWDPATRTLKVAPGKPFQIGITWYNSPGAKLAGVALQNKEWNQLLPVPVREGGCAIQRGGLLCLPVGPSGTSYYTFEPPANFPAGHYQLYYYPIMEGHWSDKPAKLDPIPFMIQVGTEKVPGAVPATVVSEKYCNLYPAVYDRQPALWNDAARFRDMQAEGFILDRSCGNFLACPGSPAGKYELAVRGSGVPILSKDGPEYLWPKVSVFLSSNPNAAVGTVDVAGEDTGVFTVRFTAAQPFDTIQLKTEIIGAVSGRLPVWVTDFRKVSYGVQGQQYARLRGVTLRRL